MSADGILVHIGSFKFFIHQSVFIWMVLCILVGLIFVPVGRKFKKADPSVAPKGTVLVFEQIVNACKGVIGPNLNDKTWKYLPTMGTIMVLMVLSNMMGLVGLQPPTSNISVTGTLVLAFALQIQGNGIKTEGVIGRLKDLASPNILMFPINLIGELAFPLSLTLRLFGNMLGGTIIIGLLYLLISNLLPYSGIMFTITPFLHMYFDIFVAFIQTYIFFMLVSYFLGESLGEESE